MAYLMMDVIMSYTKKICVQTKFKKKSHLN